jgi:type IV secretion system protein VirB2
MKKLITHVSAGLTTFAMSQPVFAAGTGQALPWETPLKTIQQSLSGPVAFSIAVIAMAATGGMLVFGGELTEFTRKACMLVLAIAFLVAGQNLIQTLFPNATGALI